MLKIFHVADIHLDSPLKNLAAREGAPRERLMLATRRAVENLVALAAEERPDVVVIAGDVFDGDWRDYQTGLFFLEQMRRLREQGVPVVAIRGNHDAASQMSLKLDWRGTVRFLAEDRAETVEAGDLGLDVPLVIHGRSFASRAETANLAAGYPAAVPGVFNLGLLHTSLDGVEGHATYAPCTRDDLLRPGYDYWALGHIHKRAVHDLDGPAGPRAVFPGNLQGRHVRENEPKGLMIVTWDGKTGVTLDLRELDVARWHDVTATVPADAGFEEAVQAGRAELERLAHAAPGHLHAVRMRFVGATAANGAIRRGIDRLRAELDVEARELADDRLWLESVRVATTEPRGAAVDHGPVWATLTAVLAELRREPGGLAKLVQEDGDLAKLIGKLPADLMAAPDSGGAEVSPLLAVLADGGAGEDALAAEALALLESRLTEEG